MWPLLYPTPAGGQAATRKGDRGALLTEIARNRDAALDYYQDAMATAANPEVRAQLADQLQQVWDREETERRAAYLIWRDCTAHVKTLKAQKTKKAE